MNKLLTEQQLFCQYRVPTTYVSLSFSVWCGVDRINPAKFFTRENNNGGRVTRQGADPINLGSEISRHEVRINNRLIKKLSDDRYRYCTVNVAYCKVGLGTGII